MNRLAGCSIGALVLLLFMKMPASAQKPESAAQRVAESRGVTEKGPNVLWGWANFVLLAGGLGYLIKKHAGPYFAQRSLEIGKGIADAEAARACVGIVVGDHRESGRVGEPHRHRSGLANDVRRSR